MEAWYQKQHLHISDSYEEEKKGKVYRNDDPNKKFYVIRQCPPKRPIKRKQRKTTKSCNGKNRLKDGSKF